LAPFPAFTLGGTIPWGPFSILTPVADVNIGVLYIMAISSLGVYGLVLAGYSANNKYSLMGGLRASAQLISYELAMGMSLGCIVLSVGSLKPTAIVTAQSDAIWGMENVPVLGWISNWNLFTPYGLVAAVIFFICMIAETNRAPFDLPEAENELIAGYHTEYSSLKFAVFFMGEYAAMIVWSAIFSTIFLGGWHLLPIRFEHLAEQSGGIWTTLATIDRYGAPIWLVGKVAVLATVYIWVRGTLPRLRYDQLMSLGWKTLLPTATANLILVATWIVVAEFTQQAVAGLFAYLIAAVLLYGLFRTYRSMKPKVAALEEHRRIVLVKPGTPKPSSADPEATPAPT
jgi:NADH-quinone oxidoreductase subunit H